MSRKSKTKIRDVSEFLDQQDVYTKHRPLRKNFHRRKVIVSGIDDQWQADLIEAIKDSRCNSGYRYILTCIDVFSKYAWTVPLKNKSSDEIIRAFETIFKGKRMPRNLQTDMGKEFYNSKFKAFLNQRGIKHFSSQSILKASVVERFNRTLKEKLERIKSHNCTRCWIKYLDDVVNNYNSSYHRSIKMSPLEALDNEAKVWDTLYGCLCYKKHRPKFVVGDTVRLAKYKSPFEKGYKQNFSTEIFRIAKVKIDREGYPYYYIKDMHDEDIQGSIYEPELVRYNPSTDK